MSVFAQTSSIEEQFVKGFIASEFGNYLIVDNGYINLVGYDPYEEYYKMIYNDSTIVNPNIVISDNYSVNIIPYLFPEISTGNKIYLEEPLKLGLFIKLNKTDQYEMTNFGYALLDSLLAD